MFIPKLGDDPSSFAPCFFAGGKKPLNLPRLVVWLGFLIPKSKQNMEFPHDLVALRSNYSVAWMNFMGRFKC